MGVFDRIRHLTAEQQAALAAIDHDEQAAVALENLEAEHIAAQEAYLRRKDRLLGRDVAEVYQEIETARALLGQASRSRQERFEALRIEVLAGTLPRRRSEASQLSLLPGD